MLTFPHMTTDGGVTNILGYGHHVTRETALLRILSYFLAWELGMDSDFCRRVGTGEIRPVLVFSLVCVERPVWSRTLAVVATHAHPY